MAGQIFGAGEKGRFDPARFIRRMADHIDYSVSVADLKKFRTTDQVRDFHKKKPPTIRTDRAMGKWKGEILRFERNWQRVPIPYQAVRFGASSMVVIMKEKGNKSLFPEGQVDEKEIKKLIIEEAKSQGRSLTKPGSVSLTISKAKGVGFERIKGTHEYRDPNKQSSGDPIHQGARAKFKRYAITELQIFGKKRSAGRKGTEFQGLGLEPPLANLPNRASVSSKKNYVAFQRVGYPGRSQPDTITNDIIFPLHYEMWQNRAIKKELINTCRDIVLGVFADYGASMTDAIVRESGEARNDLK